MTLKKKRLPLRRLHGQAILGRVPTYCLLLDGNKTVTTARNFAKDMAIKAPAIFLLRRSICTMDSYFLSRRGMFGLDYVENNYFLFPDLESIIDQVDLEEIDEQYQFNELDIELEEYKSEYSFI